jgi:hypothetical protein
MTDGTARPSPSTQSSPSTRLSPLPRRLPSIRLACSAVVLPLVTVLRELRDALSCIVFMKLTTLLDNSTKTANVQAGETTAVFGLGAVGLAVVQGAVARKASKIIAIDTNDGKEAWARKMGATDFINPMKLEGQSIVEKLVEMTDGGLDHTLWVLVCWVQFERSANDLPTLQRLHWKRQRHAPGSRGLPQGCAELVSFLGTSQTDSSDFHTQDGESPPSLESPPPERRSRLAPSSS